MNKVYQYVIKLQDMFSPTMQRAAALYERNVSFMGRIWNKFSGMLKSSTQTVGALRSKLSGLATGFKIRLDSSELDGAERKAGRLRDKMGRFLTGGSLGQSALLGGLIGGGLGGLATEAISLVKDQIATIADKTLGASQRNQSTMFSLNELMGKGAAAALVKDIDRYAPEKREGLISGAQKLSGSGVESSKLMDTLTALNNISAITGENVADLAMIQAKIKATGYVQGDEINMFKERGINLNPYLAQVMGAKETDIAKLQSKGLITYEIFDKAMQAFAGKGGRFDGAYERKQTITEGKEDTFFGKVDAKLRSIGDRMLPIKDAILDMLIGAVDGTGPLVAIFDKLWSFISPITTGIQGLLQAFGILNEQGQISQNVFNVLSFVWDYFGKVAQIAGGAIMLVSKMIGWLIDTKLAVLITGIYAASKAWMLLNAVMAMNPFSLVVIGIAAVTAGIMYAWDKFDGFREGVLKSWAVIKTVFSNIGGFLKAILTGDVSGAIAIVGKAVTEGSASAGAAVQADRLERYHKALEGRREKRREKEGAALSFSNGDVPGKKPGGIGEAAGLSSTVGNSKSNSVVINIKSLIEKSEINLNDFQGMDVSELESKMIEVLLRVANSGKRLIST